MTDEAQADERPAQSWPRVRLGLFLLLCLFFVPTLWNKPVMDEGHHFRPPGSLLRMASIPVLVFGDATELEHINAPIDASFYYRPLTLSMYSVFHSLFGNEAFPFALYSILAHIVATLLFAEWIWRTWGATRLAFLGGLIFGIHPAAVGNASWIGIRADVPVAISAFLALLVFRFGRRPYSFITTSLIFGIALGFKELGIAIPVLIGLVHVSGCAGVVTWNDARRHILGWSCVLFIYLLLRGHSLPVIPKWDAQASTFAMYLAHLAQSSLILCFAFGLFLWPVSLGHYTFLDLLGRAEHIAGLGTPDALVANLWLVVSAAILGLTLGGLWLWRYRKTRIGLGSAWCVVCTLPALPLLPTRGTPFGFSDRHLYLPALGFALVAGSVLDWLVRTRHRRGLALALLPVGFWAWCGVTRQLSLSSADHARAFERAHAPAALQLHLDLTREYMGEEQWADALTEVEQVLKVEPENTTHIVLRILILWFGGHRSDAQNRLAALELSDGHLILHNPKLFLVMDGAGQSEEARSWLIQSLKHDPNNSVTYEVGARLLMHWGQLDQAIAMANKSLEIAPTPSAQQLLGFLKSWTARRKADSARRLPRN